MSPVYFVNHVPGLYLVSGHEFIRAERISIRVNGIENKPLPLCRRPARSSRGPQRCADVAHFGVEVPLLERSALKREPFLTFSATCLAAQVESWGYTCFGFALRAA